MTDLRLRVGGKYLDRTGNVIEIVRAQYGDRWPYLAADGGCFTQSGHFVNEGNPSDFDLISEVVEVADGNEPPPAPTSPPTADLRTRAALAAMTGILAGGNLGAWGGDDVLTGVAGAAVKQADALIAALKEATDGTE